MKRKVKNSTENQEKLKNVYTYLDTVIIGATDCYTFTGPKALIAFHNFKRHNITAKVFQCYPNNKYRNEWNFKDGIKDGLCRGWYENEQLKYQGNYCDDKKDGIWQYHNKDGSMKSEKTWNNGRLIAEKKY